MRKVCGGELIRPTESRVGFTTQERADDYVALSPSYRELVNTHYGNPRGTIQAVNLRTGQAWGFNEGEYVVVRARAAGTTEPRA